MKQRINESIDGFIFEANLSNELLKFKEGDTIIVKKDFLYGDIDFRKTATSWWGKYISSVMNAATSKKMGTKAGNILFIFTKDGFINSKGDAVIKGYAGSGEIDRELDWTVSSYQMSFNYKDWNAQMCIIALMEGFAEVISYNSVNKDEREKIEGDILKSRVSSVMNKSDAIFYGDMEITDMLYKDKNRFVIQGFNKDSGEKMQDILIKYDELKKYNFVLKDGTKINGNPFDKDMQKYS
jgi:hypothetical protein